MPHRQLTQEPPPAVAPNAPDPITHPRRLRHGLVLIDGGRAVTDPSEAEIAEYRELAPLLRALQAAGPDFIPRLQHMLAVWDVAMSPRGCPILTSLLPPPSD